jgi:hypothetical protein
MPMRTAIVLVALSLSSLGMSGYFTSSHHLDPPRVASHSMSASAKPILEGDVIPEIEVLDWIQGEPIDFHHFGSKLTVIDVWSDW